MPRKPQRQSRAQASKSQPITSAAKGIYQCIDCGSLVDAIYCTRNNSWCPACGKHNSIVWAPDGIPEPSLYGQWCREHNVPMIGTPQSHPHVVAPGVSPTEGASAMKRAKTHTGTYSCPECCLEFDLVAEEALKCDRCGGPLYRGTLDEVLDGEEDEPAA
jgi:DNA-directed RNA polymerase subunit RPC12/RpoP